MRSGLRKYFIRLALALVVLAAALPATATAAKTSSTLRFSGLTAEAVFSQVDASGCVYTFVDNFGISGRATQSGVGSTRELNISAFVDIYDACNNTDTLLMCSSDTGSVNIDRQLTMATLSGTLTCVDFFSGEEVCELSKSETLQGSGDVFTALEHVQFRQGGFLFNGTFRGQFRDATVTSASITGCGISLTEQDVVYAQLGSVTSGSVNVSPV
jgi:hypothetical protein